MDSNWTYKKLFTLADLSLLVLAAWLASKTIIAVAVPTPGPESTRVVTDIGRRSVEKNQSEADAGIILKRNLFGSRVTEAAPDEKELAAEDIEQLPESTLPLELLGTVVQADGKRSFAIVLDKSVREQRIYLLGDEISQGVTVASIARNRIVIDKNGVEEVLEKTGESAEPETKRQPRRLRPETNRTASAGGGENSIAVRKVDDSSFVLDRREVEGVLQDFNKLLTQVRVVPHFSDGKPDGFKIFNIRPGSLFAQLGMVNGDIVKRVNGLEISGPEQALQMFTQLRDESQVTVDLERFRKNLTLQYEIR
jgi:general secretion pathway protein C